MAKIVSMQKASIDKAVSEYDALRAQKKAIDERMKVLAKDIKDYASMNGARDDKGSFYLENEQYNFGSQCKKSISLDNDKVVKYFTEHGLTEHIETKAFVSEDTVERLSSNGTIPFDDLEGLCNTKTTYSLVVTKKEEVKDEVTEHSVMPIAASKKPKLPKKKGKK